MFSTCLLPYPSPLPIFSQSSQHHTAYHPFRTPLLPLLMVSLCNDIFGVGGGGGEDMVLL